MREYQSGGHSVRQLSTKFGIPRSTIQGRLNGNRSHQDASKSLQTIPPAEEEKLAQWVSTQCAIGNPPTQAQIKLFANRILAKHGISQTLGNNWVKRFMQRHSIILPKRARRMATCPATQPTDLSTETVSTTRMTKSEFMHHLGELCYGRHDLPTRQLLARKLEEALEQMDVELAQSQLEHETLKAQLAEIEAGRNEEDTPEESDCESIESEASCFEVQPAGE